MAATITYQPVGAGHLAFKPTGNAMSLGVAFKGPEGIVLAADSRVTLNAQIGEATIQSTFDNATKLLEFSGQRFIGAVTYGVGALGTSEPRTAHSYLPEFDESLASEGRLTVEDFAHRLGSFFADQWQKATPGGTTTQDMVFLVGGFDEDAAYGRVFQVKVPSAPDPVELNAGQFGPTWGGQLEYTSRIIHGFDPRVPALLQEFHTLKGRAMEDGERNELHEFLRMKLATPIPYQFLPLQDCVDLCIFLVRTTAELQGFYVGARGVGGAIDVATITRTAGFTAIQRKSVKGERNVPARI